MKVNEFMAGLLLEIVEKQPQFGAVLFDDSYQSPNIIGDLIDMYQHTRDLETRELITEFMLEAGYPLLRRLVTRDLSPAEAMV